MKKTLLSAFLFLFITAAKAQEDKTPVQPESTPVQTEPTPVKTESAPVKQETPSAPVKEKKPFPLPVISLGYGMLNFNGDVGYSGVSEPLTAHSGFQIEVQHHTDNGLAFSLFYLNGKLLGEEKNASRALNFKTNFMSGGLMVRYDFLSKKNSEQVLIPFITAGVEYLSFNTNSDLEDANGVAYQYWSDGTIRSINQNDPNADQASLLYRDYKYETDLREANLDGEGKYKNTSWGIPFGAGVRLMLTDQLSMHLSCVYHMTGTDYLDGITSKGTGPREGDSKNDGFLYSSVSLRFDLFKPKEDVDWKKIMTDDADKDGIADVEDDSSGTPLNNVVDAEGKPLDTDDDGIPDYRDKEPNSASDAVVTQEGVTITEDMIEEAFKRDSLAALPAVIEYIKSYDRLTERKPEVERKFIADSKAAAATADSVAAANPSSSTSPTKSPSIPAIYTQLDNDGNGILTPKEMGIAIDAYLAKKSPYSVSEFFDLIDYFFSQK